ncbi:MAG: FixH family protein [Alphaproteobacteria bacterium]
MTANILRAGLLALALFLTASPVGMALALAKDYRFETVGPIVKSGNATVVKIRLVHIADGKPVTDAVIFQTRLDMGPDGMASMTAPVKTATSAEPGIYAFEIEPSMAGNWGLTLAAKVQGEAETVRGTVTVAVSK